MLVPGAPPPLACAGPGALASSAMNEADAVFEQASAALAAGDATAAEAGYARLLAANPQHIAALRGLAAALKAQDRGAEAADQQALADALEADAVATSAGELLRAGRLELAENSFRKALAIDPDSTAAHKGLGDLARLRGAFAQALEHYRAALAVNPDFLQARAAAGALDGRPLAAPPAGLTLAVPFVHRREFLPRAWRDTAFAYGLEHLGEMQDATVVEDGDHQVQAQSRQARLLYEPPEIIAWFLPRIEAALPEVFAPLGVAPFTPTRIELQMTLHSGGHFYRAHRDVSGPEEARSEIDSRRISFVYYMSRRPRPFRGGELRLYDSDLGGWRFWEEQIWSRIEPDDNSIVFFPSAAMHEVCPVELDSDDPADGRLTLNGWVHGPA